MTKKEMGEFMELVFEEEIMATREEGQKEYAGTEDDADAFSNFKRLAAELDMDQKKILWVYAMKHRDGIASYLKGHTSQREDVTGRIKDLIVYLFLLFGMIQEEREEEAVAEAELRRQRMETFRDQMFNQQTQGLGSLGSFASW